MPSAQVGAKVWIVWGQAFPQQDPQIFAVYASQGHANLKRDQLMVENPGWVYRVEGHRIAGTS